MKAPVKIRKDLILINKRQKIFYNERIANNSNLNLAMKVWANLRSTVYGVWSEIGIRNGIIQLHRKWLDDLRGYRVLDLGCNTGNVLSTELATKSAYYLGIDLSDLAIKKLRKKLANYNLKNAKVETVDFIDPNFNEKNFDIIYAHSVIHHFKDLEIFLQTAHRKLAPNGMIVTFDPMETSMIALNIRKLYRPFQSNTDWEFPLKKRSMRLIEKYFHIERIQGIAGLSKWIIPFVFIPNTRKMMIKIGKFLHKLDLKHASKKGWILWGCLSVSMCLRRKENIG